VCVLSRRHFLGRIAAGASLLEAALWRAGLARAQSTGSSGKLFDIEQAGPHVWIALARPAVVINCNAVIFEQSEGLVVVDTHSKPSAAAALIAQIREEVSNKPVRFLINTHFHYDHTQGTAAYRKLDPRPAIVSSEDTRILMRELSPARVKASLAAMQAQLESARGRVAPAKDPIERLRWGRFVMESEAYIREMENFEAVLPDVTFDGPSMVLVDRMQDLQLVFRGRAHTASDICVWSAQSRVIATGDVLAGFVPGMGDGYPADWPLTLRKFGELDFAKVLPGHGLAQEGKRHLTGAAAYLDELNEEVGKAKRAGRTLEDAQKLVTPASLKAFAGEFGKYVEQMESRFRLLRPDTSIRQHLAQSVRANVEVAFRAASK
jgi:glyoxylase-like metal-dependent hydrolase (beta-lactamase superfamily II)